MFVLDKILEAGFESLEDLKDLVAKVIDWDDEDIINWRDGLNKGISTKERLIEILEERGWNK